MYRYKVVMLGDASVGKTNIHSKMINGRFLGCHIPTIGADYGSVQLDVDGTPVILTVWDTAGQERFAALTSGIYMKDACGVILVYDITNETSFHNLSSWKELSDTTKAGSNSRNQVRYLMMGNKSDLEEERKVPPEIAKEFAYRKSMNFLEVSAFDGKNIREAFLMLAKEIHYQELEFNEINKQMALNRALQTSLINLEDKRKKKKCCD